MSLITLVMLYTTLNLNSGTVASCLYGKGDKPSVAGAFYFMNKTHGLSGTPLYKLWATIKNRCYNEKDHSYPNYGGIGVRMCDEWKDNPLSFIEWAKSNGWKNGLQIDKDLIAAEIGLPPNLYSPERCRFVTHKENMRQTRNSRYIEFNGKRLSLKEWSIELGINQTTLLMRLDVYNYPVEKAFNKGWRGRS